MFQAALMVLAIGIGDQATVQVDPLKFDPAALKTMEQKQVTVTEKGKRVVYEGVPLRAMLGDQLKGGNAMVNMRDLVDAVILVRGADDYQAAVSAAEVAMDKTGERYILAISVDGQPLTKEQGPVKLIIPADGDRARWVRMVVELSLVRLPRPRAK